jgi:hypothetical protein
MTAISSIPPTGAAREPGKEPDIATLQLLVKGGGTFNWVINGLNGIAANEGFLLELFQTWLNTVKDVSTDMQNVENALRDLLSSPPTNATKDIQTILSGLKDLGTLGTTLGAKLTAKLEKKYGVPLPAQWQKFVDNAVKRVNDLVKGLADKFSKMWQDHPTVAVQGLIGRLWAALAGESVDPASVAKWADQVRADMQGQHGEITPTWSAMNSLFDTMTNQIQGAQYLNGTVSAREQEIASEIQAVYQGAAKVVSKQFQTLMAMIRLVMSSG